MRLKKDPNYRKLNIGRRGLSGGFTFWLSDDHLLQVENAGYTERYRRFQLDEIRAIHASRTATRLLVNLLGGVLFAVFGALPMLTSGGDLAPLVWGGIFAVVFGVLIVVNSVRGPTCNTRIVTAVQNSTLRGVTRLSKVEVLIEAIRNATGPVPGPAETGTSETPGEADAPSPSSAAGGVEPDSASTP